jgi:hypothetical protein
VTRLLNPPSSEEFTRLVQQYENKYKGLEQIYLSAVKDCQNVNDNFSKHEVETILQPFLLKWGRMGRVLGYKGCGRIGTAINQLKPQLDKLKNENLATIDFNEASDNIEDIYDELLNADWKSDKGRAKRVGPTATAKVLHILLPDLFMIWDRKVRVDLAFQDNSSEYLRFLENMQAWNQSLSPEIDSLSAKYGKSCTKLLDEYNWKKCWG